MRLVDGDRVADGGQLAADDDAELELEVELFARAEDGRRLRVGLREAVRAPDVRAAHDHRRGARVVRDRQVQVRRRQRLIAPHDDAAVLRVVDARIEVRVLGHLQRSARQNRTYHMK